MKQDIFDKSLSDRDYDKYSGKLDRPDVYLTTGEGSYLLEITGFNYGTSNKSGKYFNQQFVALKAEVLHAEAVQGGGGPELSPGDDIVHVKFLNNKISTKEVNEMICAILDLPPAIKPTTGAFKGLLLSPIDGAIMEDMARDDGATVVGIKVFCTVKGVTKEKGKYAGQTFYNATFCPVDENDCPRGYCTLEELLKRDPEFLTNLEKTRG